MEEAAVVGMVVRGVVALEPEERVVKVLPALEDWPKEAGRVLEAEREC